MICNLQRSISVGKQPDGDYVNVPADGSAFSTSDVLITTAVNDTNGVTVDATTISVDSTTGFSSTGFIAINSEIIEYTGITATTFTGCTRASLNSTAITHSDNDVVKEVYTSAWVDTDGWNTIEVFVATNQVSLQRGLIIEHTDDTQATPPTSRGIYRYSFSNDDVSRGSRLYKFRPVLDGFRIHYIDGDTSPTSFFLDSTLKTSVDLDEDTEKISVSISGNYKDRKAKKNICWETEMDFPQIVH